MDTPNVPDFRPAEESIEWAKGALTDFETKVHEFFAFENRTIVREFKPETGRTLFKIRISQEIPFSSFKRRAVESLLHIRHSFDQTTNIAGTHLSGKKFGRNFPWSNSLTDLREHRLKGFPDQLRGVIESQEPYPRGDGYSGGDNLIRALARLSNNKHSVGFAVDIVGQILTRDDVRVSGDGIFAMFGPNWDPVKQEVLLFYMKGGSVDFGDKTKFGLNICFEVPELSNPPDVVFSLNEFLRAAERNLKITKAVCKK